MTIKRILRHLVFPHWRIRMAFPRAALQAIEAAVEAGEKLHDGELRFVVEGGMGLPHLLRGVSARERAIELFSGLRVWDTEHNSGVLIYVQLADRQVEILADRGIHKKLGDETWQRICRGMELAFRIGNFQAGAEAGVNAITQLLAINFPASGDNPDELENAPLVL